MTSRRSGFAAGASPQGLLRRAGASPQGFVAGQGLRRRAGASPQGLRRRGFSAGQGLRRRASSQGRGFAAGQGLRRTGGPSPQGRGFVAGQGLRRRGFGQVQESVAFYVLFCYHRTFGASEIRTMICVFLYIEQYFPFDTQHCLDILSTIYFVGVACSYSPKNVSRRLVKEPCTWCLQCECQPARALQRSSRCFWCDVCCSKQIIKQSGNIATVWEATRSRSPRLLAAMPQKRYRLDFSFAGLQRVWRYKMYLTQATATTGSGSASIRSLCVV